MNKKIITTGCASFISLHTTEIFVKEDDDVLVLDNCCMGSNINPEYPNPKLDWGRHDVTLLLNEETKQIYNSARPSSLVQNVKVSMYCAINMLDLGGRTSASILRAATTGMYGDPEGHPPSAEVLLGQNQRIGILSYYSLGKQVSPSIIQI